MTNVEAAALALGIGIAIFMVAEHLRNKPASAGDPSIDPSTGGVKIPTPEVYGPPKPIAVDTDSFLTN